MRVVWTVLVLMLAGCSGAGPAIEPEAPTVPPAEPTPMYRYVHACGGVTCDDRSYLNVVAVNDVLQVDETLYMVGTVNGPVTPLHNAPTPVLVVGWDGEIQEIPLPDGALPNLIFGVSIAHDGENFHVTYGMEQGDPVLGGELEWIVYTSLTGGSWTTPEVVHQGGDNWDLDIAANPPTITWAGTLSLYQALKESTGWTTAAIGERCYRPQISVDENNTWISCETGSHFQADRALGIIPHTTREMTTFGKLPCRATLIEPGRFAGVGCEGAMLLGEIRDGALNVTQRIPLKFDRGVPWVPAITFGPHGEVHAIHVAGTGSSGDVENERTQGEWAILWPDGRSTQSTMFDIPFAQHMGSTAHYYLVSTSTGVARIMQEVRSGSTLHWHEATAQPI